MAAERQAKWDELERLVAGQDSQPAPGEAADPTLDTVAIEPDPDLRAVRYDEQNSLPSLDIAPEDLRIDAGARFASDLKVELPDDLPTIDVTPATSPTVAEPDIAAMMPSAHFDTPSEPAQTEERPLSADDFNPVPPPVARADRADVGTMRLDVARISADIQSGEELYRRAQQRIEKLADFVERAEVDFSLLNRLEPENRRLKARNRTVERELDATAQKMSVLRADLEDRERRLAETSRMYEAAIGKLSVAQKSLQDFERALSTSRETSDRHALASERLQTSLDVERRENETLRDRMATVIAELDAKQAGYLEAKKVADSLAQDCADFRHDAETAQKDADALRKALATAQTQNNAMKAEMMSLHADIRTFKTQSEFTIISREDEMTALQQQVAQLTKQLDIKDEIVRNAARDVQELRKIRTAQDLERERLESQVQNMAFQLDEANNELVKTRQDVTDFDRRYRDVATALSVAQARRMSNEPVAQPDIQPAPIPGQMEYRPDLTADDLRPAQPDEFDAMSEDDIEDRIMDFRLGLRKDIT